MDPLRQFKNTQISLKFLPLFHALFATQGLPCNIYHNFAGLSIFEEIP